MHQTLETRQELFTVASAQHGHAAHLHCSGELDMATFPVLEGWLGKAESNGNTSIVVDLERVTFMDGSGLRALLAAAERARKRGRTFALVNSSTMVRRLLQITNTNFLLGD